MARLFHWWDVLEDAQWQAVQLALTRVTRAILQNDEDDSWCASCSCGGDGRDRAYDVSAAYAAATELALAHTALELLKARSDAAYKALRTRYAGLKARHTEALAREETLVATQSTLQLKLADVEAFFASDHGALLRGLEDDLARARLGAAAAVAERDELEVALSRCTCGSRGGGGASASSAGSRAPRAAAIDGDDAPGAARRSATLSFGGKGAIRAAGAAGGSDGGGGGDGDGGGGGSESEANALAQRLGEELARTRLELAAALAEADELELRVVSASRGSPLRRQAKGGRAARIPRGATPPALGRAG